MLTKNTTIDKIEIVGDFKHVQVRQATAISEDGVELSRSYHRYVVAPTDDYSDQPDDVKAVCKAIFSAEVIEAYKLAHSSTSETTEQQ